MNGVLNTIAERSSIRAYTEERLTDVELRELLTAGLQAPTARNEQEIHFSVLSRDLAVLQEIEEVRACNYPVKPEKNFYYDAPTVIFVSGRTDFSWSTLDAGIAVENLAIAATSMGLGNLIIGCIRDVMEGEKKEYFHEKCQIPEGYEFKIAFAVGHADTEKAQHGIDYEKNVSIVK